MIALLIGGIVVLCVGIVGIVFGIPVKEFSFGNTLILAGSVIASAGLLLIGLHIVVRELRAIARQLEVRPSRSSKPNTLTFGQPSAPQTRVSSAPLPNAAQKEARFAERNDEMLFSRDQPGAQATADHFDDFQDNRFQQSPLPSTNAPSVSASWQEERPLQQRPDAAERGRRDILFASKRRNPDVEASPQDDEMRESDLGPDNLTSLESTWPQSERPQRELPRRDTDGPRERLQPPRRAEVSSVTIVKSGVVDSMAYSLYSDGSIEAQTPDGMVRFGSIDELRAHLDLRR